jgi:hypothetical protein
MFCLELQGRTDNIGSGKNISPITANFGYAQMWLSGCAAAFLPNRW